VVRDAGGKAVSAAASLAAGDAVSIEFADGAVGADVTGAEASGARPERKPAGATEKPQPAKSDRRQGRLL
jgi:exodeoxyribonuclease VII large subunit